MRENNKKYWNKADSPGTLSERIAKFEAKTTAKKQKQTLAALGLRRLGMSVEDNYTPNILGMLNKVSHLVTVEK